MFDYIEFKRSDGYGSVFIKLDKITVIHQEPDNHVEINLCDQSRCLVKGTMDEVMKRLQQ